MDQRTDRGILWDRTVQARRRADDARSYQRIAGFDPETSTDVRYHEGRYDALVGALAEMMGCDEEKVHAGILLVA